MVVFNSVCLEINEVIRTQTSAHTERRPCEHTRRRQPFIRQGQSSQKKSTPLTPQSKTTSHQSCEKINLCCFSFSVCGTLLHEP